MFSQGFIVKYVMIAVAIVMINVISFLFIVNENSMSFEMFGIGFIGRVVVSTMLASMQKNHHESYPSEL